MGDMRAYSETQKQQALIKLSNLASDMSRSLPGFFSDSLASILFDAYLIGRDDERKLIKKFNKLENEPK